MVGTFGGLRCANPPYEVLVVGRRAGDHPLHIGWAMHPEQIVVAGCQQFEKFEKFDLPGRRIGCDGFRQIATIQFVVLAPVSRARLCPW